MSPVRVAFLIDTTSYAGRQLLVGAIAGAREHERWVIRAAGPGADLDPSDVDGVIAGPAVPALYLAKLSAAGVPCVSLAPDEPQCAQFVGTPATVVRVRPDTAAAGRLAAESLLGTGATAFAHTLPRVDRDSREPSDSALVVRAFVAHVGASGGPPVTGPPDGVRVTALSAWVSALPKPCGVLAATAADAFHLLEAAALAGVRVPDDLHVLAAEADDLFVPLGRVTVAHLDLGYAEVGRQAAMVLGRMMTGTPPGGPAAGGGTDLTDGGDLLVSPAGVVAGRSLRPAADADPLVRQALDLMAGRLADPLPVPALAAALGVSRRTLELRFEAARRGSPANELRRLRVERACRLLVETDQPVRDVATACGFSAVELLQRALQKQVGMTPSEYRTRQRARG